MENVQNLIERDHYRYEETLIPKNVLPLAANLFSLAASLLLNALHSAHSQPVTATSRIGRTHV